MNLLKELSEGFGAPGFEDEVRAVVLREVKKLVDEVKVDALGNVIALKRATVKNKTSAKKLMFAGHMDEIGFVVSHVNKGGFLRISPLGGFDPKTLIAKRVMVHGKKKKFVGMIGTKPIHVMSMEERSKMPQLTEVFVDVGLKATEVKKHIEIGDWVTLHQNFLEIGDLISGKSLDNRIAVWTLIQLLRDLQKKPHAVDVYAVFTTQEEVGLRGAVTSAYGVNPDVGIAIDVTVACDIPGCSEEQYITKLGEGVAVEICNGSTINNHKLVSFVRQVADKNKIKYQLEVSAGGTDSGGMWRAREGVPVATISLPTRNIHTVVETAHKRDLQGLVKLLTHFVQEAHKGEFGY